MLSVDADGTTELASTLGAAAAALVDLEGVDDAAGDLVLGAARVPRDRGTLAASLTSVGGVLSASARHAPFVHWGTKHLRARPFLLDALAAREEAVANLYADHVEDALDTIKGA